MEDAKKADCRRIDMLSRFAARVRPTVILDSMALYLTFCLQLKPIATLKLQVKLQKKDLIGNTTMILSKTALSIGTSNSYVRSY